MAFSKEHRRIAELKNIERHHGFMDVDGATIQECAEFIMTPVENEETRQNAKNISSTFGNVIAWLINVSSAKKEISGVNEKQLLSLYLCLAQAPYNGSEMKYTLHTFDKDNLIDQKMMKDLRKLNGKRARSCASGFCRRRSTCHVFSEVEMFCAGRQIPTVRKML